MTLSARNPEDVVNLALTRIGSPLQVANMRDGTRQARAALSIYAQTRDETLRGYPWGFAEVIIAAVLSGSAAPSPWAIEYNYPADCLQLRNLFGGTYTGAKNNPIPTLYQVANNGTIKVIWTNITGASLVYTKQITNPAQWDAGFIETLAAALGRRLSLLLATPDAAKLEDADAKETTAIAEQVIG